MPLPRRALLHRSGGHGRFTTCFGRFAAGGEGGEGDLAVSAIDVTHGGSIALRCLLECARTFRFPDSGAVVLVTGQDLDGVQERNSYETQERCRLRRWDEIALRFPVSGSRLSAATMAARAKHFPGSAFRRRICGRMWKMTPRAIAFRFPASADPPRGAQRKWRSISAFRLPPTLLEGRREMEGHVASLSGDRFSEITFRRRGVKQWCEIPPGIQYSPSLLELELL